MAFSVSTRAAVSLISGIEKRAKDESKSNKKISDLLEKEKNRQFSEEGKNTETAPRWAKLSRRTLAERAALGFPPGPILVRTGKLKKNWAKAFSGDFAALKSNTKYAAQHQSGRASSRLPQRKLVEFKRRTVDEIKTIIVRHLLP